MSFLRRLNGTKVFLEYKKFPHERATHYRPAERLVTHVSSPSSVSPNVIVLCCAKIDRKNGELVHYNNHNGELPHNSEYESARSSSSTAVSGRKRWGKGDERHKKRMILSKDAHLSLSLSPSIYLSI